MLSCPFQVLSFTAYSWGPSSPSSSYHHNYPWWYSYHGDHHHHHHPIIIVILNNIPHHHHGLHLKTTLLSPAVIMHGWVHFQNQWLRFVFFLYSQQDRTGQDYVVVCVDMKHSIQCWNTLTRSQFYFIVYLYIFGEHVWYFVHFRCYPRYDVVFCVDATSALFPLDYLHHLLFI